MKLLLIALCIATLSLAACSSPEESGGETGAAGGDASGGGAVVVDDFSFAPAEAAVAVGGTVEWTVAEGSSDHTVVFDDEESDTLAAGDTYSRTFDEAGEFSYVCGIHPQMTGTVTVE